VAEHSFRCRLITPAAQVLDEAAVYASVPAWDGLFGVLPNRAPIVAKLGLGELRINLADKSKSASRSFLVEDGFVQMVNNKLTILAAKAFPVESLTTQDADAELASVQSRTVTETDPTRRRVETERLNKDRARAQAKARLARRGTGRGF
jgi:F-type H+-transporting ATPase subunit epsilon